MDDPRALLDAYAASRQEVIVGGNPPRAHLRREPMAPAAFAALRAVLDRHYLVYDEADRCRGCWNPFRDNYEPWPCSTVQAITTALEADCG